jgi:fatty-acyl-CoA synthase
VDLRRLVGTVLTGGSLTGGSLTGELAEYCRARLAAAKVPVRWLVTDSFPMTPSGNIRKDVLRDRLGGTAAP